MCNNKISKYNITITILSIMAKYARPRLFILVMIVLLLALIIYNLGVSTYTMREGITAKEVRDKADAQTNSNIEKNKPQPEPLPKNFDISILDTKDYDALELAQTPVQSSGGGGRFGPGPVPVRVHIPRFIELFPGQKYFISSTSEGKINPDPAPRPVKLGEPTLVTLPVETGKFNTYIAIAPDKGSSFPPEFKISINNRQSENGIQTWLWGFSITKGPLPKNGIINGANIANMPYNQSAFTADLSGGLSLAGVNIGNNAIHVVEVNPILNKNSVKIGEVTSSNTLIEISCTIPTDKLTGKPTEIITGILIYLGFPDK